MCAHIRVDMLMEMADRCSTKVIACLTGTCTGLAMSSRQTLMPDFIFKDLSNRVGDARRA